MGNVLSSFKFVVRETEIEELINNKLKRTRVVNIALKDKVSGMLIPHPLTNFIRVMYEYRGKSLNSQLAPARVVCDFLNFLYKKIDEGDAEFTPLKEVGISGVKYLHGSRFISSHTELGNKKSTVEYYENFLKVFFSFLEEQRLISPEFPMKRYTSKNNQIIIESPFRHASFHTKYPSKKTKGNGANKGHKLKDFGQNRYLLVTEFIQKALEFTPDIALGICLQFYGGIRRGELVNVTRGDVLVRFRESFQVQIQDNRELLFKHLKDTSKEYPKRLNYLQHHLANQTILDNDLVWEVYSKHIKMLDLRAKRNEIKNLSALFVDSDGKPMSGTVYERRFNKLKRSFLLELSTTEGRYEDYKLLSETHWSTHIGRGNFTNFLFDMGLSITQIAIARGDTSIDSAMEYVDEKVTLQSLREAINTLKNMSVEQMGRIDVDVIKNHWRDRLKHG
ncbi:site-specific integrase [Paenibacillus sp. LMG 31458]|uniref:Site-specific integrase n=1 Tax=Paenibacillus phytorum TaxID=2654977 RepID=A0ABX1XVL4_9BACL|nr:site-specific integrase [Paenibacillus phytorum]NOU72551.1 site-specific integrase [Paenibacillus phytorum]